MKKPRTALIVLLTAMFPVLLTACTENTQSKDEAIAALAKSAEIKQYRFSGTADLSLGTSSTGGNPLTAGLLSYLKESKIEYKGLASEEPVRLEADMKITPKKSGTPIELPFLIKDNKMYFQLPVLNQKDEYFFADFEAIGALGGQSAMSPDKLKNTSKLTSDLSKTILEGMEAKWFEKAKEPVKLADGTSAKQITLTVTKKNEKEVSDALNAKMPALFDVLKDNGVISADQAEKMKADAKAKPVVITAPSSITVAIDEKGFIRQTSISLAYNGSTSSANPNRFTFTQNIDDINQEPKFSKEIPKNLKSFTDMLKFLAPTKK